MRWKQWGGYHEVETTRWKQQDGDHRVETTGWIPQGLNNGVETTGCKPQGGNNGVDTMRWKPWGGNHGNNRRNNGNDRGNDGSDGDKWRKQQGKWQKRRGNDGGNDGNDVGNDGNDGGNDGNDGGNHLKMTNFWMPATSLIMVRFSIRKKFWKALDLLYQMAVETTGKRRKRQEETTGNDEGETTETTGKPQTGLWLKIRLEMLSSMVSWFPPHGVMGNDREMDGNDGRKRRKRWGKRRGNHGLVCGLKLDWKMLSSVVSWFPPRGVVGNDRETMEMTGGNDGETTEMMGDT